MTIVKHRPQGTAATPFDEFINSFFGRDISQFFGHDEAGMHQPRVNITENKEAFKLDILAPGFGKEELKLNVEENTLSITAEHRDEALNEGERFTRREFTHRSFKRSFRLPENVNTERITAEHSNGILTVRIPKVVPVKPAQREISIA
jgi:HSP20 family protein